MSPKSFRNSVLLLAAAALLAACSTTRRLGAGEVLYTGVKKIRIEPDSGVVLSSAAESAVKEPLSVAPNNPLYSPYLRTPLPIGLWAWNYFYTPKEKGFKYWFYKRLAKQPVLISKVQPELRTRVAEQVLENYGYFGSRASDSLLHRKHGRKAKVNYTLRIAPPFRYSEITYPAVEGGLKPLIDSLHATSLLRTGAQYNLDTLALERQRIARLLRNRGYYYFRPEYLEYLADTTISPQRVAVRLNLKPNTPEVALKPYRVGDIMFIVLDCGEDKPDDFWVYAGLTDFDGYRTEQAAWFGELIRSKAYKSAKWRIVMNHFPPLSHMESDNPERHGIQDITDKFLPLYNQAKIDLMISGHTHAYEFMSPDKYDRLTFPVIVNSTESVARIDIDGRTLKAKVTDTGGNTLKEFTISK